MLNTQLSMAIHSLALIYSDSTLSSEKIAESINTNPVVIRRLNSRLKKAGLLTARVGVSGYTLTKEPQAITLLAIYQALDLDMEFFGIHRNPNPDCQVGKNIQQTLNTTFKRVQTAMEQELAKQTLQDMLHLLQL